MVSRAAQTGAASAGAIWRPVSTGTQVHSTELLCLSFLSFNIVQLEHHLYVPCHGPEIRCKQQRGLATLENQLTGDQKNDLSLECQRGPSSDGSTDVRTYLFIYLSVYVLHSPLTTVGSL